MTTNKEGKPLQEVVLEKVELHIHFPKGTRVPSPSVNRFYAQTFNFVVRNFIVFFV